MTGLTISAVIAETAHRAGLLPRELTAEGQRHDVVYVRQRAMWAARRLVPSRSLTQIGRAFGRHHTTVIHAIRAVDFRRLHDPFERAAGDELLDALRPAAWLPPPLHADDRRLVEAAIADLGLDLIALHAETTMADAFSRLNVIAEACARAVGRCLMDGNLHTGGTDGLVDPMAADAASPGALALQAAQPPLQIEKAN